MTIAGLAFEALMVLVAGSAAILCWRLDRRLAALRAGQDGVAQTVAALNDATVRAEASIRALRAAAEAAETAPPMAPVRAPRDPFASTIAAAAPGAPGGVR